MLSLRYEQVYCYLCIWLLLAIHPEREIKSLLFFARCYVYARFDANYFSLFAISIPAYFNTTSVPSAPRGLCQPNAHEMVTR